MTKPYNIGSLIIIVITFTLFALALFTQGLTHDILLEAGVFLVSLKLIVMAYNNKVTTNKILKELNKIKEKVNEK